MDDNDPTNVQSQDFMTDQLTEQNTDCKDDHNSTCSSSEYHSMLTMKDMHIQCL